MVRNYDESPVDPDVVDRALRNATRAPSAGFSQGWGFLVLDRPDDVRRFWAATTDPDDEQDRWLQGMSKAPVVVVPCSSKAAYLDRYAEDDKGWADRDETRWPVPYWDIDTGMASLLILQTAVDEGLGACFFGVPPDHIAAVKAGVRHPRPLPPDRRDHDRATRPAPRAPRARRSTRVAQARRRCRPPRSLARVACGHGPGGGQAADAGPDPDGLLPRPREAGHRGVRRLRRGAARAVPAAARAPRADPDPHARAAVPLARREGRQAGRADGAPRRRPGRGRLAARRVLR